MSRKIKAAPGLAQDRARRLVNHLIGTGGGWTVAVTVLFLVSLGWFTDSLFEWMTAADHWLVGWAIEPWMPLHRIVGVLLFPLLVLVLYRRARGARDDIQARIVVETEPYPVQGLILYLSNLRPDQIEQLEQAMREPLDLDALCKTLGSLNWYMPFRAIDFHKSRLRHVIAICSADEQSKDGEIRYGSASQFDQFAQLLERLLPEHRFSLLNASELPDDETAKHPKGIDFEAADVVSDVTNAAFRYLRAQGLPLPEILIDITGGQKPNAVAGTAIALAEGRRIQYVSLKDYRVKVYDVTYEQ
jgi:hypothetical protein